MSFNIIRTHPGTFHADDVFAVAFLLLVNPNATVSRERFEVCSTRAQKTNAGQYTDIIVDVGGHYCPAIGLFDHHQASFKEAHTVVPNQCLEQNTEWPMAAFGLVWRQFGFSFCSCDLEVYEWMIRSLICYNDALDNGIEIKGNQASLTDIVDDFNCLQDLDQEGRFAKAVAWAQTVIQVRMEQARKYASAYRTVQSILKGNHSDVAEVPPGCHWFYPLLDINTSRKVPITWVIYHRQDSSWAVQAVSTLQAQFTPQYPFPEKWRGLTGQDLKQVTALSSAVFCHKSGHLFVCGHKDDAVSVIFKLKEFNDLP